MRRAILLLAMTGLGVMVVTGVALAANLNCNGSATGTNGNDLITGGQFSGDRCAGGGGNDTINGRQGIDFLFADFGTDVLNGGANNDFLNVADFQGGDRVDAGADNPAPGFPGDVCVVDENDQVFDPATNTFLNVPATQAGPFGSCEVVTVVGE